MLIWEFDVVLVGINWKKKKHWTMLALDNRKKPSTLTHLDSLKGFSCVTRENVLRCIGAFKHYMERCANETGAKLNTGEWKVQCCRAGIPSQDTNDCGVSVCTMGNCMAWNKPFDWDAKHGKVLRADIVSALKKKWVPEPKTRAELSKDTV